VLKAAKNAARRMALRGKASAEAGQTAELRGDGGKMGKYFGGLDLGICGDGMEDGAVRHFVTMKAKAIQRGRGKGRRAAGWNPRNVVRLKPPPHCFYLYCECGGFFSIIYSAFLC
jgi:hypothetical protein